MNLAVNARDAMPDGGTLTIETAQRDHRRTGRRVASQAAPGAYVRFSVRDTGVGMDADTQARIFEPFFTTKAPGRGTGLGLATVYGIVKQSGGVIDVESEPGQGTTFHIFLPAVAESAVDAAHAAPRPATSVESASILLIEDDAALRRLLARSLERVGHRVRDAADSDEALALLAAGPGHRPADHRRRAARASRARTSPARSKRTGRRSGCCSSPGYSDDAILRLGLLNEQEAFLQKPFGPRTFVHKVQQVLRG